VLVTAMISWKLLSLYYRARKYAHSNAVRMYTSVVAIFIESAAPSAVLGLFVTAINTYSVADAQRPWAFAIYLTWCMVTVSCLRSSLFIPLAYKYINTTALGTGSAVDYIPHGKRDCMDQQ
jgi:hypothetical protein